MSNKIFTINKHKGLILLALVAFLGTNASARVTPENLRKGDTVRKEQTKENALESGARVDGNGGVMAPSAAGAAEATVPTGALGGDRQQQGAAGHKGDVRRKTTTTTEAAVAGVGVADGATIIKNYVTADAAKLADLGANTFGLKGAGPEAWNAFGYFVSKLDADTISKLSKDAEFAKAMSNLFSLDRVYLGSRGGFENGSITDLGKTAMNELADNANAADMDAAQLGTIYNLRKQARQELAAKNLNDTAAVKADLLNIQKENNAELAEAEKALRDNTDKSAEAVAAHKTRVEFLREQQNRIANAIAHTSSKNLSLGQKRAIQDVYHTEFLRKQLGVLTKEEQAYFLKNCKV